MAQPKTTKTQAPARRHGIQSVEVAGPLLAALTAVEAPLMLKDLAAAAHMPAAKAHRYLVSLVRLGLVNQDAATGRYDLGPFALELGVAALGRLDAARPANDAAEKLRDDLGETVVLAVWGPLGVTLVRIAEPVRAITVSMRAGAVAPLTASAAGLLFAAYLPPAATAAALRRELDANRKGGNLQAPTTREALDRLLEEVRAVGMSRAVGAFAPGVNSFAAPIFDHTGRIVFALTLIGYAGHLGEDFSSRAAIALAHAAHSASALLGFRQSPGK